MKIFSKNNQSGFSAVEILVLVVVTTVLALGAKYTFDRVNNPQPTSTSQQAVDDVPEVKSSSDLKNSEDYLNKTNLDSLDDSQLDEDINALL